MLEDDSSDATGKKLSVALKAANPPSESSRGYMSQYRTDDGVSCGCCVVTMFYMFLPKKIMRDEPAKMCELATFFYSIVKSLQ